MAEGISERDRVRYARHLLLPQIGEAGQARLLAQTVRAPRAADPGALEVARTYLERAGLRVASEAGAELRVASPAEIDRIAGRPELLPAARALAGALAAVEAIRETLAGSATAAKDAAVPSISSEDA